MPSTQAAVACLSFHHDRILDRSNRKVLPEDPLHTVENNLDFPTVPQLQPGTALALADETKSLARLMSTHPTTHSPTQGSDQRDSKCGIIPAEHRGSNGTAGVVRSPVQSGKDLDHLVPGSPVVQGLGRNGPQC
jgi:hypothetical protein